MLLIALAMALAALGTPAFATSPRTGTPPGVRPTAVNAAAADASLPCDIYAAGGTPCVTAHATTRALFAAYNGPLYQVQRASDKAYTDIGLLAAGGYANAATQDSFCAGTSCTITSVQSGLCLDVTGGATADGTLAELWDCNGGSGQRWTLG